MTKRTRSAAAAEAAEAASKDSDEERPEKIAKSEENGDEAESEDATPAAQENADTTSDGDEAGEAPSQEDGDAEEGEKEGEQAASAGDAGTGEPESSAPEATEGSALAAAGEAEQQQQLPAADAAEEEAKTENDNEKPDPEGDITKPDPDGEQSDANDAAPEGGEATAEGGSQVNVASANDAGSAESVPRTTEGATAADAAPAAPVAAAQAAPNHIPQQTMPASGVPTGVPTGVPGVPTGVPGVPTGVPTGVPGVGSAPADPNAAATVTNPTAMVEERAEVSALYVGRVIGKGGEMIRDLQARSGCRIDVDQNVPHGSPRIITYRGSRKTVDFAKRLVAMLCTENGKEAELPLGEATRRHLVVPSNVIGKIIGRGGEMIRELQSKSQAKIQVDHSVSGGIDPTMRQVTVTGTEQSVIKAEEMINFLAANPLMDAMTALSMLIEDKTHKGGVWGSGPPYANMPNNGQGMQGRTGAGFSEQQGGYGGYGQQAAGYGGYGGYGQQQAGYGSYGAAGTETEIFPCSKMYMGRVIGQKGVTINDLQKRSGCDIQINQDVPPGQDCQITIKGSRQGIENAKQMLRDIIEMGPGHPYAGGQGQFGGHRQQGGYQQGGYSQQQAYQPYQQQPAAHQGYYGQAAYGQQPYQAQGYGQPQPTSFQAQQPGQMQYGGAQQHYGTYGQAQQTPAVVASPWKSATAADGQIYYYNEKTGETQWEKPAGLP